MRFDNLTKDNVLLFALKHYENHQATSEKEFYDDMKRFKYLKRLFKKYSKSGVIKERLIMNHIIVLANVFGPDAVKVLLSRNFITVLSVATDLYPGTTQRDT